MGSAIKQSLHLYKFSTHPFYFYKLLLINCFLVFDMSWSYDVLLLYTTKDLFFSFFFSCLDKFFKLGYSFLKIESVKSTQVTSIQFSH